MRLQLAGAKIPAWGLRLQNPGCLFDCLYRPHATPRPEALISGTISDTIPGTKKAAGALLPASAHTSDHTKNIAKYRCDGQQNIWLKGILLARSGSRTESRLWQRKRWRSRPERAKLSPHARLRGALYPTKTVIPALLAQALAQRAGGIIRELDPADPGPRSALAAGSVRSAG
jgi:hypothetical protein